MVVYCLQNYQISFSFLFVSCLVALSGCSNVPAPSVLAITRPEVTKLYIEVDYENGAKPYVNLSDVGADLELVQENLDVLFAASGKQVIAETDVDDMENIGEIEGETFTSTQLLEISNRHRTFVEDVTSTSIHIMFIDGFFRDEKKDVEVQEGVVGVTIGDGGTIAIFKPVIAQMDRSQSETGTLLQRYVEQSTILHEFGHAVGLVENGIPAINDHHDDCEECDEEEAKERSGHCENPNCVMYYQNSGGLGFENFRFQVRFFQGDDASQRFLLFDDDCQLDLQTALRGEQGEDEDDAS